MLQALTAKKIMMGLNFKVAKLKFACFYKCSVQPESLYPDSNKTTLKSIQDSAATVGSQGSYERKLCCCALGSSGQFRF